MASKTVYSIPKGEKKTPVPTKRALTGEPDGPHPLAGCHVGGVPVEMLPPERLVGLFWKQTDEGIEMSNRGKLPRGTGARETSGPLDKAIQRKRDFSNNEREPWLAPDPMTALVEQHIEPGMHPKFLSEARLGKEGNYTRGFEVVRNEKGDPVKLGTLVLAQMPEEHAEKRNDHYRAKSEGAVKQIYSRAKEQSGGMVRSMRELGIPEPADESYKFEEASS